MIRAHAVWVTLLLSAATTMGQDQATAPKPAAPKEFAFVLSNGYGEGDHFSNDPKGFENLLITMRKSGCNTIHCVYRDWRVDLCRKHGVKMMIDVLAWKEGGGTDIRKPEQRETVKKICMKVRGDDAVWGYNLWNEALPHFGNPDGKDIDAYTRRPPPHRRLLAHRSHQCGGVAREVRAQGAYLDPASLVGAAAARRLPGGGLWRSSAGRSLGQGRQRQERGRQGHRSVQGRHEARSESAGGQGVCHQAVPLSQMQTDQAGRRQAQA